MAWSFGDGFDLYAAPADMVNGYWDSGTTVTSFNFVAGRFAGGRALQLSSGSNIVKSSGVNDAVHHFVVSFQQTSAITGSTISGYFELFDGATAQCSVVFRSDGAILLVSGAPNSGTTLATYTGAFPVTTTWYAFEIEVVINSTTGSFAVRKNGNTVNDFSATSLNTRPVSTNNYANKLQIGGQGSSPQLFDDLFWRSDASSVAWMGDIRCYTRMPASDASATFSRTSTGVLTQIVPTGSTTTGVGGNDYFTPVTAAYSGTVTAAGISVNVVGTTTHMKCAIYADNGSGAPGAPLATATAIVTPVVAGTNTFAFTGVSVTKGVQYWVAASVDGSTNFSVVSAAPIGARQPSSYATFPQANPVVTQSISAMQMSWTYNAAPGNWQAVSEPQQDSATSYVYDSNPGDADFYGVASIASTPATVIATVTRAYMQKSDAGTRTAAVQLKSGATTVASPTLVLTTSGWQWAWRMDLTDPATGAAWTAAGVNNATIGPRVIA